MGFKFISIKKISNLPITSGVYVFKKDKVFLYIGKAVDIRKRVKNHFQQPIFKDSIFLPKTDEIGFIETNSEIEALLLEAELIKKYSPKYNTDWKDDKSYHFVFFTKEEFPRVFVGHQTKNQKLEIRMTKKSSIPKPQHLGIGNSSTFSGFGFQASGFDYVGPFVDGQALKQTLKVLRKIFPYRSCRIMPKKPCLYRQLALCQALCLNGKALKQGLLSKTIMIKNDYEKNIKNLIKILKGGSQTVIKNIKKEMRIASKNQDFEKAREARDKIFALENVFQHNHIFQKEAQTPVDWQRTEKALQNILSLKNTIARIEGYDISNIQGQSATGSMVVFKNGVPDKNDYRKFKIALKDTPDDIAMLKEVLQRRFKHPEWQIPQVILIDGGKAQLNVAIKIKNTIPNSKIIKQIKIISLAKRKNGLYIESKSKPVLLASLPAGVDRLMTQIRDEAHRFAITYHKKLRSGAFLKKDSRN